MNKDVMECNQTLKLILERLEAISWRVANIDHRTEQIAASAVTDAERSGAAGASLLDKEQR